MLGSEEGGVPGSILYGLTIQEKIDLIEDAIEDFGTVDPTQII